VFTAYSFKKLLTSGGFVIRDVQGFGPPIRDMIGEGRLLQAADSLSGTLARTWTSMFAFNFLVVAERAEDLDDIYAQTAASHESETGLRANFEGRSSRAKSPAARQVRSPQAR
jgi:hypothetical protein